MYIYIFKICTQIPYSQGVDPKYADGLAYNNNSFLDQSSHFYSPEILEEIYIIYMNLVS